MALPDPGARPAHQLAVTVNLARSGPTDPAVEAAGVILPSPRMRLSAEAADETEAHSPDEFFSGMPWNRSSFPAPPGSTASRRSPQSGAPLRTVGTPSR